MKSKVRDSVKLESLKIHSMLFLYRLKLAMTPKFVVIVSGLQKGLSSHAKPWHEKLFWLTSENENDYFFPEPHVTHTSYKYRWGKLKSFL